MDFLLGMYDIEFLGCVEPPLKLMVHRMIVKFNVTQSNPQHLRLISIGINFAQDDSFGWARYITD
jgi:hypothetical protein